MTTSTLLRPCRAGRQSESPRQLNRNITLSAPARTGHLVAVARAAPENPIIVIPARLAASRLPGKPLADIAGTPMIVHVWRRAVAADIGPVVVACGDQAMACWPDGHIALA